MNLYHRNRPWLGLSALIVVLHLTSGPSARAGDLSPVGVWETIDDNTNKAKSHIQIWAHKGHLYGRVIKLIDSPEPNPLCDECEGKNHNKPIIGMIIMWQLKKEASGWWKGGHIMDPENGKTYRCKVRVTNGGRNLEVRGYIGISLLGRTQVWNRKK